jgi:hypothetical protein
LNFLAHQDHKLIQDSLKVGRFQMMKSGELRLMKVIQLSLMIRAVQPLYQLHHLLIVLLLLVYPLFNLFHIQN